MVMFGFGNLFRGDLVRSPATEAIIMALSVSATDLVCFTCAHIDCSRLQLYESCIKHT